MLLLNRGGKRAVDDGIDHVHAEVFLPAFNSIEAMRRLPSDFSPRKLVDPQLYLAGLPAAECERACGRLASFPWFGVDGLPSFDSDETGRRDWEAAVREAVRGRWPGRPPAGRNVRPAVEAALQVQLELRAASLILPTPLIAEREDEGQTAAEWLDEGIEAANRLEVEQPMLATVAIDEQALSDAAFAEGGFLDGFIDLVSAREGLDGVYIVVAQSGQGHPFETNSRVHRAYLHLVRGFAQGGMPTIITNFADVFGLLALGAGATAVATGATQSTRRLTLAGFRDNARGAPLPRLYSHACIAEFTISGLPQIAGAQGLSRIRDLTEYSRALFDTSGRRLARPVPAAWVENPNHTIEAQSHFIARLAIEAQELGRIREPQGRRDHVSDWLEGALANYLLLRERLGSAQLRDIGRFPHLEDWLMLFGADDVE